MVSGIDGQYWKKQPYGYDEGVQEVGQDEQVTNENGSESESVYSNDKKDDGTQDSYASAVKSTGELRKMSVGNLVTLGKLKSDVAEDLIKEHEAISDECWEKLISAQDTAETDPENLKNVVQEIQIKFLNLIEKENAALKKLGVDTSKEQDSASTEISEPRTLAVA